MHIFINVKICILLDKIILQLVIVNNFINVI